METKTLFMMEDKILGQKGLYTMWTILYIINLIVLCEDNTQGASRDFNIISNGLSVLYCGISSVNMIMGTQLPSTMMLTVGPIHQYLFWMLFAYYGGSDVLGSHPIGVYNWIAVFVVGLFTIDMVIKTWYLSFDPQKYITYMKNMKNNNTPLEDVKIDTSTVQKVVAKFVFKQGKLNDFKDMLNDPEHGLSVTKSSEGFINIDVLKDMEQDNVMILVQQWNTKQNHLDYLQKRTDTGMFDKLKDMLESEPEIMYVENVI